jgi:large subunit ribosomal protein LP0
MGAGGPAQRKVDLYNKFCALIDQYPCMVLVDADNVNARTMAFIRRDIRAFNATMIMGKNTLIRKAIRAKMEEKPELEVLLPEVVGNTGFVFCTVDDFDKLKDIFAARRVAAAAKPGVAAPLDVIIPAGGTGLDPSQTSFMQALSIATKINRGAVEILQETKLISKGEKVGASQAALLVKLDIKPFSYGLEMRTIYEEGDLYSADVLQLTEDDVLAGFSAGVARVTSLALGASVPTVASFPHVVRNAYKNVAAIALATGYTYDQIAETKALLDDPEALARLAAAAAAPAAAGGDSKAAEKEPESESESDEEMGFGLFD